MDKIRKEFEKFVADGCSKEAIAFGNIEQYSWIDKLSIRAFYDAYKSRDKEIQRLDIKADTLGYDKEKLEAVIKKLRDKVNKAYHLITSQKTCIEWNEGFNILTDIIKDGE